MVRLIASIMVALVLASMAFGAGDAPGRRTLVTTFFPIHIAALNVTAGAEGVRVINLAAPTSGCLHEYSLTTRDLALLSTADCVLANGLGMESFIDLVKHRWPEKPVIVVSAGITPLVSGGITNAHVWVSPARHIRQVMVMAEQLSEWDPVHAPLFRTNAMVYCHRLESLRARMSDSLATVGHRDIITFHEAFPYFADEFGLRVVAVIEREPGTEPSAGEMGALIRQIRRSGITSLFVEPQYPPKAAEAIVRETGARMFVLDPVVSGPLSPDAYLSAMERNLQELIKALK